jgi:hypothetical protein
LAVAVNAANAGVGTGETGAQGRNKLDEARAELALAREKLVEAISERAPERILLPLRNNVGRLLEKVEMLHSADRFRR